MRSTRLLVPAALSEYFRCDIQPIPFKEDDSIEKKLTQLRELLWRSRQFVAACTQIGQAKIEVPTEFVISIKALSNHCIELTQNIFHYYRDPPVFELLLRTRETNSPPNYLGGKYETNVSAHMTMLSSCGLSIDRMIEQLKDPVRGDIEWPTIQWTDELLFDLDNNTCNEFIAVQAILRSTQDYVESKGGNNATQSFPNQNPPQVRKQKIRVALKALPATKGNARKRLQNKINRWKKDWSVEFAEVQKEISSLSK